MCEDTGDTTTFLVRKVLSVRSHATLETDQLSDCKFIKKGCVEYQQRKLWSCVRGVTFFNKDERRAMPLWFARFLCSVNEHETRDNNSCECVRVFWNASRKQNCRLATCGPWAGYIKSFWVILKHKGIHRQSKTSAYLSAFLVQLYIVTFVHTTRETRW